MRRLRRPSAGGTAFSSHLYTSSACSCGASAARWRQRTTLLQLRSRAVREGRGASGGTSSRAHLRRLSSFSDRLRSRSQPEVHSK